MVQAIVNNLNNINNVMTDKSLQFNGLDKMLSFESKDFDKFFENKIGLQAEANRIANLHVDRHNVDSPEEINLQKILKFILVLLKFLLI